MAYSELIKSFERIRNYMRDFYVYGFKTRNEYDAKSARSYDDERRRVASWLGPYMDFRQNAKGKQVFISVDNRDIPHNPLYAAFRTKSFTDRDLFLHFALLDMLCEEALSVRECMDRLSEAYWAEDAGDLPEESIVRRKLIEYRDLGLLTARKRGKETVYSLSESGVDPDKWQDAVAFYSEASPLGVVGSFFEEKESPFQFKHRYLLDALDSEIMENLADAMMKRSSVNLTVFRQRSKTELSHRVFPLRLFLSTQTGREYLLCYHYAEEKLRFFRLDLIRRAAAEGPEPEADRYEAMTEPFLRHLWGVSEKNGKDLEHLEMKIHAGADEAFIVERLQREKRGGDVQQLDEETWLFTADRFDTLEMLPWIRTFIGRIDEFRCTNPEVERRFRQDLIRMAEMYGGGAEE